MVSLKNILFVITACISFSAFGQKIKYKELFILLNAKQYDQAEPFLKKYLKEEQENPNAFLNMGYIYEEKALNSDVLKQTERLTLHADSAVLFFDKAYKTIDERELKKHDEYYQTFSRRDLRTGEFGLKLSDIQFELEKRIKALKEKQIRAKDAKAKFLHVQLVYSNCVNQFKKVADGYKDQREFFLRADENLMIDLRKLERKYDSCLIAFNDYKAALQAVGKTGYNPELEPREINNFKKDGFSDVDFLQDIIKVWDYKRWAGSHLEVIEKEIMPLADKLTKIDSDLNSLREKIRKDSVSVMASLPALVTSIKSTGLEKFDVQPFPFDVFSLKMSELAYGSELAMTRKLRDSSDVKLKLILYNQQLKVLRSMDSLGIRVQSRDIGTEAINYKRFIGSAYGSIDVLTQTIKSTTDFAVAEIANKKKSLISLEQLVNWVVDQTDSIPASEAVKSNRYFPITIVSGKYTIGYTYPDSTMHSYFYSITPSRKASTKAIVKLDSSSFKKSKLQLIKSIVTPDEDGKEFYVTLYSEELVGDKVSTMIYKVASAGLAWSLPVMLEGTPLECTVDKADELTIKISTKSGNKLVVISSDGKMKS